MNSIVNKNIKILIQFIIGIVFVINLLVSEISNYKTYSFYLKSTSILILILFCVVDYILNKDNFSKINIFDSKWFGFVLLSFIILPTISLFYSGNAIFGMLKIAYLLISTIPTILVFYYLLVTASEERIRVFLKSVIYFGLLFAIFSLIFSPFNPSTVYSFEFSRWSHVISGRLLGTITVIILLSHFTDFVESKLNLIIASTLLLTSTYFVGLRAALLGIAILLIFLLIFSLIIKDKKSLLTIILSVVFSFLIIFLINLGNQDSTERYNKLLTYQEGEFDDGAINARMKAYEVSWENIKKSPFLGIGFGGFYNKQVSGEIANIKYPHNLIIEIQLELGLVGSVYFGILIAVMLSLAYKYFKSFFVFLIFSLWLAMFSKDIATQTQLWIGLALLGIKKRERGMME